MVSDWKYVLLVLNQTLLVKVIQGVERELEVRNESVAAGAGEVLTDDDTHHLKFLAVRSHAVLFVSTAFNKVKSVLAYV